MLSYLIGGFLYDTKNNCLPNTKIMLGGNEREKEEKEEGKGGDLLKLRMQRELEVPGRACRWLPNSIPGGEKSFWLGGN